MGLAPEYRRTNCIKRGGKWYELEDPSEPIRTELVTHWMPLPDPPSDTHVTIPKMRMGLVPKDEERGQY